MLQASSWKNIDLESGFSSSGPTCKAGTVKSSQPISGYVVMVTTFSLSPRKLFIWSLLTFMSASTFTRSSTELPKGRPGVLSAINSLVSACQQIRSYSSSVSLNFLSFPSTFTFHQLDRLGFIVHFDDQLFDLVAPI